MRSICRLSFFFYFNHCCREEGYRIEDGDEDNENSGLEKEDYISD